MADTPEPKSGNFGFLTRKVGPLPVIAWAGIAVGGYLLWKRFRHPAAATAAAPTIIEVAGARGPRGATGQRGKRGARGPDDLDRTPKRREVPNVVGQRYTPAAERLRDSGFRARRDAPYVGVVRSEEPHAGTKAEPGTTVTLRGKPWPPPSRGATTVPPPTTAVAPMTNGAVYSGNPVAGMNGETYVPPATSAAEQAYVAAG